MSATKRLILGIVFLAGLLAAAACGRAVTDVDFDHAKLTWTRAVGGDTPTAYRVKCGTASGVYTLTADVTPPATSVAVKTVVQTRGTYYCVVTAVNQFGESGPSKQVSFTAGVATAR
jgi:hypothetical protein